MLWWDFCVQKNTNHIQQQEVKRRKAALVHRENGIKYKPPSSGSRACPSVPAMPVQKYIHPRRKDEASSAELYQIKTCGEWAACCTTNSARLLCKRCQNSTSSKGNESCCGKWLSDLTLYLIFVLRIRNLLQVAPDHHHSESSFKYIQGQTQYVTVSYYPPTSSTHCLA